MGITSDHEFTDYSFRHSFFRNMEVRPSGFTIRVMSLVARCFCGPQRVPGP